MYLSFECVLLEREVNLQLQGREGSILHTFCIGGSLHRGTRRRETTPNREMYSCLRRPPAPSLCFVLSGGIDRPVNMHVMILLPPNKRLDKDYTEAKIHAYVPVRFVLACSHALLLSSSPTIQTAAYVLNVIKCWVPSSGWRMFSPWLLCFSKA